jgi:1-phosphatidylinositol-4-phosphate 5-kinase
MKTEKRGSNEESVPHRTLMTVRSPSAERTNDRAGMTLPIVDEIGESSSTGGRSATDENEEERETRPPTPPKDNRNILERRPKRHEQSESVGSNKVLPPLPKVTSPEPMNEKESVIV